MTSSFQSFVSSPILFDTLKQTKNIQCFGTPAKLLIPTGFNQATISFKELMPDGVTYSNPIKDLDGTALAIASVTAGDSIPLEPAIFESIQNFVIVSDVDQTTTNPIFVVFTPIFGIN